MRFIALEHDVDDGVGGPAGDGQAGSAAEGQPASEGDRTAAFARLARDEAARLWELVQEGLVRETHFRFEQSAAVLVLECRDSAEAEAALATLPFVRAGLIRFELIGLRPYPGFARLFAPTPPTP